MMRMCLNTHSWVQQRCLAPEVEEEEEEEEEQTQEKCNRCGIHKLPKLLLFTTAIGFKKQFFTFTGKFFHTAIV
jgi:hypothetical protein